MIICEHSIDETILQKGYAIDAGCGVDFTFAKALSKMGLKVICVDPNPKIINIPQDDNIIFEPKALVAENTEEVKLFTFDDTDAATIIMSKKDIMTPKATSTTNTITIKDLMKKYSIEQLEVLKLDIEGSEYNILDNIDGPIAKQISVEFHDFRNFNPCYPDNERYYKNLFNKLLKWYKIYKHKIEVHGGMPEHQSRNYWDSLFILK